MFDQIYGLLVCCFNITEHKKKTNKIIKKETQICVIITAFFTPLTTAATVFSMKHSCASKDDVGLRIGKKVNGIRKYKI